MAIDGFFQGAFSTDLAEDEILTEIRLPATPAGAGMAYPSIEQPASGYSMVGVAAVVPGGNGGSIGHARIAITGVARSPTGRPASIRPLVGSDGGAAAAAHTVEGQTVNTDIHADAAYRSAIAAVVVRRAIEAARARLG